MKYWLIWIGLFWSTMLWAQSETNRQNSINIISGISFVSRIEGSDYKRFKERLTQEGRTPVLDYDLLLRPSYRGGLDYQRQLFKGLSVKVGVRFAAWNFSYYSCISCLHKREKTTTYLYAETPITVQYKWGKKKLQPYVEFGASALFFLHNESVFFRATAPDVSFALQGGLGLSYQFSEGIAFWA